MKFRNYCILVLGNHDNVLGEIKKISETEPNILDAKGVLIATFSSVATPRELTDYFKGTGKNFFVFDLSEDSSGVNMNNRKFHEGLFGEEMLRQKSNELNEIISSTTVTSKGQKKRQEIKSNDTGVTLEEINDMTPTDKNNLMNFLIDKGVENLSEYDKKILEKLAH